MAFYFYFPLFPVLLLGILDLALMLYAHYLKKDKFLKAGLVTMWFLYFVALSLKG